MIHFPGILFINADHFLNVNFSLFRRNLPCKTVSSRAIKRFQRRKMNTVQHVIHHPAGRFGLTLGLAIGLIAAITGEASKALFFAGFCKFLASRMKR
jgi:hypothetical protein